MPWKESHNMVVRLCSSFYRTMEPVPTCSLNYTIKETKRKINLTINQLNYYIPAIDSFSMIKIMLFLLFPIILKL